MYDPTDMIAHTTAFVTPEEEKKFNYCNMVKESSANEGKSTAATTWATLFRLEEKDIFVLFVCVVVWVFCWMVVVFFVCCGWGFLCLMLFGFFCSS